jgi:hypothetical protein
MKPGLVEIISILDRSGSMSGLEKDTIGGYNSFISKQSSLPGEIKVTTVLFDDKYELLFSGVKPVDAILNETNYFTRGSTALLDAIGKTLNEVGARLANTKEEERPEKVIVVITTDGYENASVEYDYLKIKEMIKQQSEVYKWEFLFFGANIDTNIVADDLGIARKRARSYRASKDGIEHMILQANEMVSDLRVKEIKTKKIK